MSEENYRRITYDLTLALAKFSRIPQSGMTLVYISDGALTATERGRSMGARVERSTENALLRLPFKRRTCFVSARFFASRNQIKDAALQFFLCNWRAFDCFLAS